MPPTSDGFAVVLHGIEQTGKQLENIRTEVMNRLDRLEQQNAALRTELPKEYVPRVEHIGRWAEQDRHFAEIRGDVRSLNSAVEDLKNKIEERDYAKRVRITQANLQLLFTVLGPLAGAILTLLVLRH